MKDKFAEYYSTPEKIEEMSEYVHLNFRVIMVKMQSEMRRKLGIGEPKADNSDGYFSLLCSLQGRMFNEMVYALCALCQSMQVPFNELIPPFTRAMVLELMLGKNPLNGNERINLPDLDTFNKYYMQHIEELRKNLEALPK